MAALHFAEPAIFDLDAIFDRIAQDSLEIAYRFTDELRDTCTLLAEMPLIGRARDELRLGIRSFVHKGYVILYREIEDGVLIERVAAPYRLVEGMFQEE